MMTVGGQITVPQIDAACAFQATPGGRKAWDRPACLPRAWYSGVDSASKDASRLSLVYENLAQAPAYLQNAAPGSARVAALNTCHSNAAAAVVAFTQNDRDTWGTIQRSRGWLQGGVSYPVYAGYEGTDESQWKNWPEQGASGTPNTTNNSSTATLG